MSRRRWRWVLAVRLNRMRLARKHSPTRETTRATRIEFSESRKTSGFS